jgi:hypothetical protein
MTQKKIPMFCALRQTLMRCFVQLNILGCVASPESLVVNVPKNPYVDPVLTGVEALLYVRIMN